MDETTPAPAAHAFTRNESIGALGLGVFALVTGGLFALLFGALAREGRITGAEIGLTATLETLTLGVAAGVAGAFLKPERLRLVAVLALAGFAATALASTHAAHGAFMLVRTLAGVPEGLLLWLAIGLVARTATPERGAGVMALGQPVSQILFAAPLGAWVLPSFGAAGAFAVLAASAVVVTPLVAMLPRRYPSVGMMAQATGAFGAVGWIALFGTGASVGAFTCVGVYLAPLASFAHLAPATLALAVTAALAAQIAGAALATALAGRVRPVLVLVGSGLAALGGWAVLATAPAATVFVVTAAALGFVAFLASPFLVAFIVEVDLTRSAALQSGAAQVVGAALGPLIASRVAGGADPRPVLWVAATLIVLADLAFIGLALNARRQPARTPVVSGPVSDPVSGPLSGP